MEIVSSEQLQKNLPSLLIRLSRGEVILIEHEGKPVGQLAPVPSTDRPITDSIGLLAGTARIPADWKELGREEIEKEFYGG